MKKQNIKYFEYCKSALDRFRLRIPFEDVLTILVSIFLMLCNEIRERERAFDVKGEKGEIGYRSKQNRSLS